MVIERGQAGKTCVLELYVVGALAPGGAWLDGSGSRLTLRPSMVLMLMF